MRIAQCVLRNAQFDLRKGQRRLQSAHKGRHLGQTDWRHAHTLRRNSHREQPHETQHKTDHSSHCSSCRRHTGAWIRLSACGRGRRVPAVHAAGLYPGRDPHRLLDVHGPRLGHPRRRVVGRSDVLPRPADGFWNRVARADRDIRRAFCFEEDEE